MENSLQITDHLVTIISGIFTILLTSFVTCLMIKDRKKNIAIKELQAQTKKLEELYLIQIQPRFSLILKEGYYVIKNTGGDCFNLYVSIVQCPEGKTLNPFTNWDFFSSSSEKTFNLTDFQHFEFDFVFTDVYMNKFKQVLSVSKRNFSNLTRL
jgi:hypothetical protein